MYISRLKAGQNYQIKVRNRIAGKKKLDIILIYMRSVKAFLKLIFKQLIREEAIYYVFPVNYLSIYDSRCTFSLRTTSRRICLTLSTSFVIYYATRCED